MPGQHRGDLSARSGAGRRSFVERQAALWRLCRVR